MSIVSTDERREVARRLRSIKDTRDGCGHEMCCDLWSAIFDSDYRCTGLCDECEVAVLNSLADLIEPSDSAQTVAEDMFGQMRHSTEQERVAYADMMARNSVELHPVDRDALLALADEIEDNDVTYSVSTQYVLDSYARRIREALGVVE